MSAFGLGGGPGGFGGMGLGMGMGAPRGFEEQYHCYPVSFQDKEHLEAGDKILLPSSALDALARQQVEYPMLFELSNPSQGNRTHCGVLEFSAPEGSCYIPHWMMQNLLLEAGSLLTVKNVSLPKGTFVKFQPQSVDFLEISNPRAVLETTMRHFSCLTEGDVICLPYNDRNYELAVKELKPSNAVGIVETDLNVDFDAPVGYDESLAASNAAAAAAAAGTGGAGGGSSSGATGAINIPAPASGKAPKPVDEAPKFVPFGGGGARLDGKKTPAKGAEEEKDDKAAGDGSRRPSAAAAAAEARAAAAAASGGGGAGAAPARPPVGLRAPAGKWSKSKKLQAGAFQGSGNKLA
ncbi:unnamed protein product [Ectocarpus sp. 4 AP-2014]